MREILFRGKRIDSGEWIFGMLGQYHEGIRATIVLNHFGTMDSVDFICVDPATVGQYTGLQDKNGKRIFEGDVFEWGYAGVKDFRYVVSYDADIASFVGNRHFSFVTLNGIDIKIIGNIHDNPELIGGTE